MVKVLDRTPQTKARSLAALDLEETKPTQGTISEFRRGLFKTAKWSGITLGVLIALGAVYKLGDYLHPHHQKLRLSEEGESCFLDKCLKLESHYQI